MFLVEAQTSRLADLVGALARRRATILLVKFLALDRQDNRTLQPQAAPRLHLDSLASSRRISLQKQHKQQRQLDQIRHPVISAAGAALGLSLLAI